MSLTNALQAASSGLRLNSVRADVVATNVANASTPGYVRRTVTSSEFLVGGQTAGVQASGILQNTNEALSAERRTLASDRAQADTLASAWSTLSRRLGDDIEGSGLFADFSAFETALSDAVTTPESATGLSVAVEAAGRMATTLNSLSELTRNMRAEADAEIATGVETVNRALEGVADLNDRILAAAPLSAAEAALKDERGRLLDQISEYLPIETAERAGGAIDILTPEGVFLLAGEAKPIEFQQTRAIGPETTLENGALSDISVEGVEITPGTASFAATGSGAFGALFTLRDQDLPTFQAQLDVVAGDLISRLSAERTDPAANPGQPGIFIDSAPGDGPVGLAGRIALNSALDPAQGGAVSRLRDGLGATESGPPGNGQILKNILDAFSAAEPIDSAGIQGRFSSIDLAADLSSLTGQRRLQNEATLTSVSAQFTALREAETSETGVDIDTELQELLRVEQAYAANARVIEVANQMISRLLEI